MYLNKTLKKCTAIHIIWRSHWLWLFVASCDLLSFFPKGTFVLTHVDEFVEELLSEERSCDVILPRIQKRSVLEENNQLETRVSALEEDLDAIVESGMTFFTSLCTNLYINAWNVSCHLKYRGVIMTSTRLRLKILRCDNDFHKVTPVEFSPVCISAQNVYTITKFINSPHYQLLLYSGVPKLKSFYLFFIFLKLFSAFKIWRWVKKS